MLIMSCACNDEAFDHETLDPIWRLAGTIAIFWGQIIHRAPCKLKFRILILFKNPKLYFVVLRKIITAKNMFPFVPQKGTFEKASTVSRF